MSENRNMRLIEHRTLDCRQRRVRAVRFNVDGAYCLTAGDDKKVRLWNPHTGLGLATYSGHGDSVLDACGSSDSSQLVTCGADKSVILWDVTTAAPLRRYRGHASTITCVKFNILSNMAVSGSWDNKVMLWDVNSRRMEPVQVLAEARDTITSLILGEHEITAASADCHIRTYDIRMGRLIVDCAGFPVAFVSCTRDGQCHVVSCTDGTLRLFDKDTGELLSSYSGHTSGDLMIENAVNIKDTHVISGSADGDIWYWDLISGSCSTRLTHTPGRVVHSISHHPTRDMILSACDDSVKLWTLPADDCETYSAPTTN